jgi:hypothetical protein
MLKLGTPITDPDGNSGTVGRNSRKTGVHMVRIHDRWFLASECKVGGCDGV